MGGKDDCHPRLPRGNQETVTLPSEAHHQWTSGRNCRNKVILNRRIQKHNFWDLYPRTLRLRHGLWVYMIVYMLRDEPGSPAGSKKHEASLKMWTAQKARKPWKYLHTRYTNTNERQKEEKEGSRNIKDGPSHKFLFRSSWGLSWICGFSSHLSMFNPSDNTLRFWPLSLSCLLLLWPLNMQNPS